MKTYIFRIKQKEEILNAITKFCHKHQIKAGWFNLIGAIDKATLAHYNPSTKTYREKKFNQQLEVTACNGIISSLKNQIHLHTHIVLGDNKFHTWTGHLKKAYINPTGEVIIFSIPQSIQRFKDKQTGLFLLK